MNWVSLVFLVEKKWLGLEVFLRPYYIILTMELLFTFVTILKEIVYLLRWSLYNQTIVTLWLSCSWFECYWWWLKCFKVSKKLIAFSFSCFRDFIQLHFDATENQILLKIKKFGQKNQKWIIYQAARVMFKINIREYLYWGNSLLNKYTVQPDKSKLYFIQR